MRGTERADPLGRFRWIRPVRDVGGEAGHGMRRDSQTAPPLTMMVPIAGTISQTTI